MYEHACYVEGGGCLVTGKIIIEGGCDIFIRFLDATIASHPLWLLAIGAADKTSMHIGHWKE
jgi:hypothetical protein